MKFGRASRQCGIWLVAVLAALASLARIPAALAQDTSTQDAATQDALAAPSNLPGNSPITLINADICTVQGLPVPDPLDEVSVTTSVLAVMGDIAPPIPVYDDNRANDCCILITPPDHEYRISIAARLAVEARFLRLKDENAVRHLYQLIEYCGDEITEAAFLSAYGGPIADPPGGGTTGSDDTDGDSGGGGGPPPNPSGS